MPLESSALGLWLRHKAPHLFDDAPELAQLDQALDAIRFHLADLFERYLMLEGGRDALAQLLNPALSVGRAEPSVMSARATLSSVTAGRRCWWF